MADKKGLKKGQLSKELFQAALFERCYTLLSEIFQNYF